MDPFELPAELPTDIEALRTLLGEAQAYITHVTEQYDTNAKMSEDDLGHLELALEAVDALNSAIAEASSDDEDHSAAVAAAVERARAATAAAAEEGPEDESEDESEDEPETVQGEPVEEKELITANAGGSSSTKTPKPKPSFAGKGPKNLPDEVQEDTPVVPAWQVINGAPGFEPEEFGQKVGFSRMGEALDSVRVGRGGGRYSTATAKSFGSKMRQGIAKMSRGLKVVENERELVDEINRATSEIPGFGKVTTESLTAAGGWCAPSEQIYTFCDVPAANDLISLPEIAIKRGGLRWPVEPDLTSIFESFEFFFTEPELEAVDGNGDPTAIKHCVEIPCPDEFEELRLNAVGYCVEAGILQRQGWPESIEWFLRSLTQEHLRAMSRRTILDMWNGGGDPKVFAANLQVGGTSSVLNSLELMAFNLRLQKGYTLTHPIEMVAPSWFFAALRADMAMMEGVDTKNVTDGQIRGWLTARNITGQFVGDWQTRDTTLPGHLDTLRWPGHVDVIMYPAGTWFRHMSNIIEVGTLYPKEQLQINRYTEFFTEDAIAVGKRCDRSVNLRIPLLINGGYGAPVTITHVDTDPDSGAPQSAAPVPGGQEGLPGTRTLSTTGTVTAGNTTLEYEGDDITLAWNSTAAQAKTAIVSGAKDLGADDVTVTGGPWPATPLVVEVPHATQLTIKTGTMTGGNAAIA